MTVKARACLNSFPNNGIFALKLSKNCASSFSKNTLVKIIKLLPHEEKSEITDEINRLKKTCFEEGFIEEIECIEEIINLPLVQEDLTYSIPYEVHFSCSFFIPYIGMKVLGVIKDISDNCFICTYKCMVILVKKDESFKYGIGDLISVVIEAIKIIEGASNIKAFGKKEE